MHFYRHTVRLVLRCFQVVMTMFHVQRQFEYQKGAVLLYVFCRMLSKVYLKDD